MLKTTLCGTEIHKFLYKFLYKILYENKVNVIMEISMTYDGDHCIYIVDDHVYVERDVNLVNKILVITFWVRSLLIMSSFKKKYLSREAKMNIHKVVMYTVIMQFYPANDHLWMI